jgi:DSF synthase
MLSSRRSQNEKNPLARQIIDNLPDKSITVAADRGTPTMNNAFYRIFRHYQEISVRYDQQHLALWCYYKPRQRPCFSVVVLCEILSVQHAIIDYFKTLKDGIDEPAIRYVIQASQVPGIFNLGGDLDLFIRLIADKNYIKLYEYAKNCIDICYLNAVNLHLPLTTISLVTGMALGGGFEAALSSNVVIAEKNSEMGFPEIRFNLFPGMGAFSLLTRIAGLRVAEKMITSGRIYSAWELYEMDIVHEIADSGKGHELVESFMRRNNRVSQGFQALQQVKQRVNPIDYEELLDITKLWVKTALQLSRHDLRMMERLVNAQLAKISPQDERRKLSLLRTRQDRRFTPQDQINFPFTTWTGETVMYDRRTTRDRRLVH